MSVVALCALLLGAFALLAAAQEPHRRALGLAPAGRGARRGARAAAAALITAALLLALWRDGPGLGCLLWGTLLSIAAYVVTSVVTWRPRWLAPIARVLR